MKDFLHLLAALLALHQLSFVAAERGTSSRRLKGKGKGKSDADLLPGQCDICSNGRPSSLTLEYQPSGKDSMFQGSRSSCGAMLYPSSTTITVNDQEFDVSEGVVFTVDGPFSADTDVIFDGQGDFDCEFHTSCSVPLVAGDQIGPFVVLDGGGTCLPDPSGRCEICSKENKNRPLSLTVQYFANGVNSDFQDPDKASCVEGQYPEPATFEAQNKDGFAQQFMVSDGDIFTILGPFSAETDFVFSNGDDCFIHTSCSQPLVAGDQIGPFLILEGNECVFNPETDVPSTVPSISPSSGPSPELSQLPSTLPSDLPSLLPSGSPLEAPCIEVDAAEYRCGSPITVAFNFGDALPDDWIGIYPCSASIFLHSILWQWTCVDAPCEGEGPVEGEVVFDRLREINQNGPHEWPIAPFTEGNGDVNRCFKAVLLRNDGSSVPPYIPICESSEFIINENFNPGCGIKP